MRKYRHNIIKEDQKQVSPWDTLIRQQTAQTNTEIPTHRKEIVHRFLRSIKNQRKNIQSAHNYSFCQKPNPENKNQLTITEMRAQLKNLRKSKTAPIKFDPIQQEQEMKNKIWEQYQKKQGSNKRVAIFDINKNLDMTLFYLESKRSAKSEPKKPLRKKIKFYDKAPKTSMNNFRNPQKVTKLLKNKRRSSTEQSLAFNFDISQEKSQHIFNFQIPNKPIAYRNSILTEKKLKSLKDSLY